MQDSNFYDGDSLEQTSRKQHLFLRYFTAFLIDLVVLNIIAEYWQHVSIYSFTVSLFAASLLQLLLQLTLKFEEQCADYFNKWKVNGQNFYAYLAPG